MRGAGLFMYQVGFLCENMLIIDIDDEVLKLEYDVNNKKFVNVSKFDDDIVNTCREVVVDISKLYSTKYYPRVYYDVYKLEFEDKVEYLLERYDGTMASSRFYLCRDIKECNNLIGTLEGE